MKGSFKPDGFSASMSKSTSPSFSWSRSSRWPSGSQEGFPVIDDDNCPVGFMTRERLFTALREFGEDARVATAMDCSLLVAEPDEALETVVHRGEAEPSRAILVVHHGQFTGLLTQENIAELYGIMSAIGSGRRGRSLLRRTREVRQKRSPRFSVATPGIPPVLSVTQPAHSPLHD